MDLFIKARLLSIRLLAYLFISLFLLAGCSTHSARSKLSPLEANQEATRYLELANNTTPLQSLEYHLQATIYLIEARNYSRAQDILRENRANHPSIDPNIYRAVSKARLALLNKDYPKALSLLRSIVQTLSKDTNQPSVTEDESKNATHIALLLPSKGTHAKAAKYIQDGFLAAYYESLKHQPSDPTVKLYDTGDGNQIAEAYEKALKEHATFIVGPLTKPELESMVRTRLSVPVLALNSITESTTPPPELYQFGLMPEDEVIAVAELALKQHHRHALVLAPQTEWGKRLADAFKNFWREQDAKVVDTRYFNDNRDLESTIQTLLKVKNNSRRDDIDMIFVAASPEVARQIKPLLSFYYADDLPIYATASVYTGKPTPHKDQELNGIQFCDMPWAIQHSFDLQDKQVQMQKLWPNSTAIPRFFALGMDAYQIAIQLSKKSDLPPYGFSGYTGYLTLNPYRQIKRGLVCAKFVQGVPTPIH